MFKQRKNKTFNYQSKFSKESEVDASSETSKATDFVSKWRNDGGNKRKVRAGMQIRALILLLVLLLICMYILDSKFK